jgi:hypothetical protein
VSQFDIRAAARHQRKTGRVASLVPPDPPISGPHTGGTQCTRL